jgi:hypothetical protein
MEYEETRILHRMLGEWLDAHPGIEVIPYDECNILWSKAHKEFVEKHTTKDHEQISGQYHIDSSSVV